MSPSEARVRPSVVDRLEERRAPGSVVDAAAAVTEDPGESLVVEATGPGDVPAGGVTLRPLPFELPLGLAVIVLLLPEAADAVAAVVPDHRAGGEAERPAAFLDPPADVDVVAGDRELRIEAADGAQAFGAERHVAARECARRGDRSPARGSDCRARRATLSATTPSPSGAMLGPPMPACSVLANASARYISQCSSGQASSSR